MGLQGLPPADGTLDDFRRRLAIRQPTLDTDPDVARAGVALVLQGFADNVELLLIQRAIRDGDPWSGHVAFPGGRHHADDATIVDTASRETYEEVGIDLRGHGELIGRLDDLHAAARGRALVVSPLVWALVRSVKLRLDAREVQSAVWLPLSFLHRPVARAVCQRTVDGVPQDFPAYHYEGYTIWGHTYTMIEELLGMV